MKFLRKFLAFPLVLATPAFVSSCVSTPGSFLSEGDSLTDRYEASSVRGRDRLVSPVYQTSASGWRISGADREAEKKAIAQDQPFAVLHPGQ